MNFIIFDLEWNNAYNYKTKKGMNEIIEIGAVKLNSRLEIVDSFKQLIKPQISKKLGSRFKNLTHITMSEIKENGIPFDDAFDCFSSWCSDADNVFLSWSMSDLYTLISNYKKFKNTANIDFMKKYADAQKYCMSFIDDYSDSHQISLSKCAEIFSIETENISFHRALEDCMITALCFKKVYDEKRFNQFIHCCDTSYFEKLIFKPYFICEKVYKDFDVDKTELECPVCKGKILPINEYQFANNTFKNAGECQKCKKKFWIFIRAKQNYDSISVSKRVVSINKRRAKSINKK